MLSVPTSKDLNKLWKDDRSTMFKYVVNEIKQGIDENLPAVNLFQFKDNTYETCNNSEYREVLENAMQEFVEKELYEDAAICRDLLIKLKGK